jgi:hypothetical protein
MAQEKSIGAKDEKELGMTPEYEGGNDMQQIADAIDNLAAYDHALISAKGCKDLAAAFGVADQITTHTYYAGEGKGGLTLFGGEKKAEGLEASVLACQICNALGVEYESKLGRGFQLRTCCEALRKHYGLI